MAARTALQFPAVRKFIPTLAIALVFLPGFFAIDFGLGTAVDLETWLFVGLPVAWLLAVAFGWIANARFPWKSVESRILGLTVSSVLLFFPIRAILVALAEEITAQQRIRTGYHSEGDLREMYYEFHGIGNGFAGFGGTLL